MPLHFKEDSVQIVTEFHIARDLRFAKVLPGNATERDGTEDAPDVIIVLEDTAIVIEAKFFHVAGAQEKAITEQFRSQRRQVRHLNNIRPAINSYFHVALLPRFYTSIEGCDGIVEWRDIAALCKEVLGEDSYVTQRLSHAVEWYDELYPKTEGELYYNGDSDLEGIMRKCEELGASIQIGHTGGLSHLRSPGKEAERFQDLSGPNKKIKWRDPASPGSKRLPGKKRNHDNWIPGSEYRRAVLGIKERQAGGM